MLTKIGGGLSGNFCIDSNFPFIIIVRAKSAANGNRAVIVTINIISESISGINRNMIIFKEIPSESSY